MSKTIMARSRAASNISRPVKMDSEDNSNRQGLDRREVAMTS
jgi:hypothetical protein